MRNLGNLKLGETGIVKNINSTGTLRRRLIDLGVTAGARVKIERFAPFGDPIIVNINNYNLVMRKKEAREIEIFEDNNVNIYNYVTFIV